MAKAKQSDERESNEGLITDADIERGRAQIGIPQYERNPVFNREASTDTMSHFAFGIGDSNPLWHDPEYGMKTRWRGQIAFPMYLTTVGTDETPPPDENLKKLFRGLFRGVGKYYSGTDWTWFRPVRPGDIIYREQSTADIEVKEKSSFTGGRTVIDRYRYLYVDRDGRAVAERIDSFVNAERQGSKEKGKHAKLERQTYTPEDIKRIDDAYEAERPRGAEPRYWEDVRVGDELDPIIKGPMTIGDVVGFHIGWGFGQLYGAGPLSYASKLRRKVPAFHSVDPYGVPQIVQRLHWDTARAEELGLPAPYDYGTMRTNWLVHLVTHWMGDDGWLFRLKNEIRSFNFIGDTTTCSGTVTGKRMENGRCFVDIAVKCTNQRGDVTAPGIASVILPSREHGPALLPEANPKLEKRGAEMMSGAAERLRAK
jgi:acyl dehydratase